jgi:hypothetical protein
MERKRRLQLLIGIMLGAVLLLTFLLGVFPITAMSVALTDATEPQSQELNTFTESATLEPISLLPLLRRDPTPIPTPTPTSVPQSILLNGGFEQGPDVWNEYSSNGWQLILQDIDLPVSTHNGRWAAWLGGDANEASILSQDIYLAASATTLRYWHWIASEDICNPDYDIAGVLINDAAVDAFLLCEAGNTNGWRLRTVDLNAYVGQNVILEIAAFTDSVLNSNLFIDDVSLGSNAHFEAGETSSGSDHMTSKPESLISSKPGGEVEELFSGYRLLFKNFIAAQ